MRRHTLIVALVLLLASQPGRAQVTVVAPGSNPGQAARPSDASYGPPQVAEFESIVISDTYQRRHVITECEISAFRSGQYWTCGSAGAMVLIIPGTGFDAAELDQGVGKRTEVRGIVRAIREKKYVKVPGPTPGSKISVDLDLIEDPLLPPLPPPNFDQGWPRISITVFAIKDRHSPGNFQPQEMGGGIPRRILEEPAAYAGKTTKILGQFRGRNLFGDLPPNSARGKEDWVLKDGDTACWVMGRAPKGDGWKLDLDYKGDSKTWLEVEGKAEVVNGVVYLKASRVIPSRPPGSERRGPGPR